MGLSGIKTELEQAAENETFRQKGEIKETYVHKQCSGDELRDPKPTASMKKVGNHDVRHAIEEVMGSEVYETADSVRSSQDEETRTVQLHGSLGRKFARDGNYVLEINVAGSGFTEFRKMEHNSTGKHTFTSEPVKDIREARIQLAANPTLDNSDLAAAEKFNSNVQVETMLNAVYGERFSDPEGKMSEYIRVKETSEGIKKVFIPGPGEFDSTDSKRSMDSARHNALTFAKDYLTEKFETFRQDKTAVAPIKIMIQGHSRGGVAAGESLQMIEYWVNENYPEYKDLVNFSLIQYDPVPGTGSYGNHKVLDFNAEGKIRDGLNKADRDNSADPEKVNTTVMYSMKSTEALAHRWFFDPQKVIGAKRVIISPECHSLMLGTADDTQNGGLAKIGFTLAETGEVYRGSGLNELPEGVYVCDESHTLVKVYSPEEAKEIMMKVAGRELGQHTRFDTIIESASECIERTNARIEKELDRLRHAPLIPDEDGLDKAGKSILGIEDEPEAEITPQREENDVPEDWEGPSLPHVQPTVVEKPSKPIFFKFWFRKLVGRFDLECKTYEIKKAAYDNYLSQKKETPAVPPSKAPEERQAPGSTYDAIAENLYKGAVYTIRSRDDSEIYQETVNQNFNDPEKKAAWVDMIKKSEGFRKLVEGKSEKELSEMIKNPVGTYVKFTRLLLPEEKKQASAGIGAKAAQPEVRSDTRSADTLKLD